MKPEELRIGNWILEDETIYTYGLNKIERQITLRVCLKTKKGYKK